jgi:ribosomal protein S18 acetylase RimI-like enzyme
MDYVIRPLTAADEPILWETLYQGLQITKGESAPSRDIARRSEFARYVEDWGRAGDTGFVAYDAKQKGELLGAVWLRIPMAQHASEAESTPELAFVVKPGHRRHGIGAALLTQLVKANPQQSMISIRAPADNPAVRLYERFGFKIVQKSERAVTMRREA